MSLITPFNVYGIGLGKTGTTSLNQCLNILGWNSVHFPNPDVLKPILDGESEYDAATDTPIAINYQYLFQKDPSAKFILTVREISQWLKSIETHMATKGKNGANIPWVANLRQTLYGSVLFDEKIYQDAYYRHNSNVINYFTRQCNYDFSDKLLVIDITDPVCADCYKWEKIYKFLGVKPPLIDFPHGNKGRYNEVKQTEKSLFTPNQNRSVKELTT